MSTITFATSAPGLITHIFDMLAGVLDARRADAKRALGNRQIFESPADRAAMASEGGPQSSTSIDILSL